MKFEKMLATVYNFRFRPISDGEDVRAGKFNRKISDLGSSYHTPKKHKT